MWSHRLHGSSSHHNSPGLTHNGHEVEGGVKKEKLQARPRQQGWRENVTFKISTTEFLPPSKKFTIFKPKSNNILLVPFLVMTILPSLSALVSAWRKDSISMRGEFIWGLAPVWDGTGFFSTAADCTAVIIAITTMQYWRLIQLMIITCITRCDSCFKVAINKSI